MRLLFVFYLLFFCFTAGASFAQIRLGTTRCAVSLPTDTTLGNAPISITWGDGSRTLGVLPMTHLYGRPGQYQGEIVRLSPDSLRIFFTAYVVKADTLAVEEHAGAGICGPRLLVACGGKYALPQYRWPKATWLTPTGATVGDSVSISAPGSYTVQRTGPGGCPLVGRYTAKPASDTTRLQVYVGQSLIASDTLFLPKGQPLRFKLQGNPALCQAVWQANNQTLAGTLLTERTISQPKAGLLEVSVSQKGLNGCLYEAKASRYIYTEELPNLVTYNKDNRNDALVEAGSPLKVAIYNRWGLLVREASAKSTWPDETTAAGIYFYQAQSPEGTKRQGWVEVIR
jgi:CHU_C Type IX secretion signal domain